MPFLLGLVAQAWQRLDGAVTYEADPRVDACINALPDWQADICRDLRTLVHEADPEVVETVNRTDRP